MAKSLLESLEQLRDSLATLGARYRLQSDELARVRADYEALAAELADTRRQLQKAQLDIEFLSMSWRLASSPDTLIESRRHIAGLIRKLDLSIALLKEG